MAEPFKCPNLLCFHLLAIIIIIIIISNNTVLFTNSLSFNYPNFADTSNITLEGAIAENQELILVYGEFSVSRATYFKPMKLWDNATGQVTDFATRFTFVIDSNNRTKHGDGMAFFLARKGFKLKTTAVTRGGSLGITEDDQRLNVTKENSFVAVEFDIYSNDYDPVGAHVGIDINSMKSIANVTWLCNVREGKMNEALVVYNSTTQELSVNFTGFRGDVIVWQFLSHKVDLKSILPEEVTFGFSAGTGISSATHSVHSWEFISTLEVTEPLNSSPSSDNIAPQPSRGKKSKNLRLVLGLGLGGFVVLVSTFCFVYYFVKWKEIFKRDKVNEVRTRDKFLDDEFRKGTGPRKFSYKELTRATSGFKDELGKGGFGSVYKGFLPNLDLFVAIKKQSKLSRQGVKEYAAEVKIISKLRHKNLVQLVGWCHEKGQFLLAYEFLANGSLDSHLFDGESSLSWETRYKIALGLAYSLRYLHEESESCVLHRDIKSSNVMLDSNFNAKLGDFGLARLVDEAAGQWTTGLAGTVGYMAPEYIRTRKASKSSDVFSFGVVMLEIACGRKTLELKFEEDRVSLVSWVWECYGNEKLLDVIDERLTIGDEVMVKQMEALLIVGLWCVYPDHKSRPSIKQVIQVLGFEANLPHLPKKMPSENTIHHPVSEPSITHTSINVGR